MFDYQYLIMHVQYLNKCTLACFTKEKRINAATSLRFFRVCFSHSRFCLIYLHCLLGRSFVTTLQVRTEKSTFL